MKYHPKQLQIDYLLLPIQFWFYVFIFINQIRSYFPSDTRLNIKPLKAPKYFSFCGINAKIWIRHILC